MSMIRLQSGAFVQSEGTAQVDGNTKQLDKKALLVYCGKFESMDGPVEITDEHIDRMAATHNGLLSQLSRLATGDIPLKNCPPIQLDHSTSAKDTVGRLIGNLEVGDYKDGDNTVKALYGTVRILGAENVEKVSDGRWTNLSIGADLETGKVSELTITPFPAAPNAALLSKIKLGRAVYNFEHKGKKMSFLVRDDDERLGVELEVDGVEVWWGKLPQHPLEMGLQKAADFVIKTYNIRLKKMARLSTDYTVVKKISGISVYKVSKETQQAEGEDPNKLYAWMDENDPGIWSQKYFANQSSAESDATNYLRKSGRLSKGEQMFEKLKAFLVGVRRMAEGDATKEIEKMSEDDKAKMAAEAEKHEKLKKHLMESEKMSAEDADKKLAEMPDEEKQRLASAMEDPSKEKKDEKKEMSAKLTAAKEKITKLSTDMTASFSSAKLQAKKTRLSVRLSTLQSCAKITPAEIKKINLAELASKSDDAIEAVLKSYEDREPVILTGVLGNSRGVSVGKMHKQTRMAKMEKDMLSSMPFTRMAMGVDGKEQEGAQDTVNIHVDTDPHTDLAAVHGELDKMYGEACSMMDKGLVNDAKEHLKKLMEHCKKHMGGSDGLKPVAMETAETEMSALAQTVEKLQNQQKELLQLVSQVVGE